MFLLILCLTNPIDTLLRTIFHISDISLTIPSNSNCKINEIKGMKYHNSAQSSLDTQVELNQMHNALPDTLLAYCCYSGVTVRLHD